MAFCELHPTPNKALHVEAAEAQVNAGRMYWLTAKFL